MTDAITPPNSFRVMIKGGQIKRTDKGMFIALEHLNLDPGFNKRREGGRLDQSIRDLADFLIDRKAEAAGGIALKDLSEYLPQIEAYPHTETGLVVVEGHRRTRALQLLQSEGYPIPMVPFKPFTGDALARKARIATSNNQLELEPMELADLYTDLQDNDGLSHDDIAELVNKTRQHVEQTLLLGRAGADVKAQIDAGIIAPGTAVAIIRQHGENAGAEIARQHDEAKAQGKSRVTNGTIKKSATPVPRALAQDVVSAADRLSREVPDDARALLERYRAGETALGDQTVPITLRALNALVMTTGHVTDVQAEQARKAAGKAQEQAA
jgi:ParB-like chromosome segregation protein Spo0J